MNKRLDWVVEGGSVWRVDVFRRWKFGSEGCWRCEMISEVGRTVERRFGGDEGLKWIYVVIQLTTGRSFLTTRKLQEVC
jgi:hypothetical protein